MRVAQLVETLGAGGAERLALEIAAARAAAGDESHLIVLSQLGPLAAEVPDTVAVHCLGLKPRRPLSLLGTVIALHRLCRRLQLDVLQTHLPLANYFGLLLATGGGRRVFPTVHNNREFDYGDARAPLRAGLRRFAYRRLLAQGTRMIAVSDSVKAAMVRELSLSGVWPDRIVVVPNGVRLPVPPDPADRARARARWRVGPDEILIAAVGRLGEQKNFGDLVAALAALPAGVPSWRCVVAGEGPLRERLQQQIAAAGLQERLVLAGHVAPIDRLLGAADLFCLSSLWEGLPLALLEAMAAGLPVAAYAIDGVVEVVTDGEQGRLAAAGRPAELSAALASLLQDTAGRRAMGLAAAATVRRRFGFDQVTRRLDSLYQRGEV